MTILTVKISRDQLDKFSRTVPPAPAPIEPLLPAADEAALIAKKKSPDPTVAARRTRVLALLRRPAPPEGSDAALIALLAAANALPVDRDADRVKARARLHQIGAQQSPPPEILKLCRDRGIAVGDGAAFANALMPERIATTPFTMAEATQHP